MSKVFVDTAAFFAIFSKEDRYSAEASDTYQQVLLERALLYTTNLIVAESCSLISRQRNAGYRAAIRFGEYVRNNSVACEADLLLGPLPPDRSIYLVYSTPELERRAWAIFEKYDTAGFSFTDCVSFAVMEALSIKQAFTFDEHYDVMGFERLPG